MDGNKGKTLFSLRTFHFLLLYFSRQNIPYYDVKKSRPLKISRTFIEFLALSFDSALIRFDLVICESMRVLKENTRNDSCTKIFLC